MDNGEYNCTNKQSWIDAKAKSIETNKNKLVSRISAYNKSPNKCRSCDMAIPYDRRANKFCGSSCSASFNNKGVNRHSNVSEQRKCEIHCLFCGNILDGIRHKKYCSLDCQHLHITQKSVEYWKANFSNFKKLPAGIRKYLISSAGNKCCQCGWGEINIYSGNYALLVDHIDGNPENNAPDNLRVLCARCDSLLPTYKGLNKGKGRSYRRLRYSEGKSF